LWQYPQTFDCFLQDSKGECKMIAIENFMNIFLNVLNDTFRERVWFVGLQGSYGRDEATETSDIDVVVIIDELSAMDIQTYNDMLDTLPHRELICGFISGKEEIMNWEPSDLFQFCHDTTPIKGSLDEVMAVIDESAVNRAIKIGVCNIYHGCVHNMLHEKSEDILRGLYKSASFVVQAIAYKQTGSYINRQKELLQVVSSNEQVIVETFMNLKIGGAIDFNLMSETLFSWSKKWISENS
jgi:predicted nucleotidyltransferase